MKTTRKIILSALVAAGSAGLFATGADAYVHNWGYNSGNQDHCTNWPTNTRCYDRSGQQYNPWHTLTVTNSFANSTIRVCVKAVTASGNVRSLAYVDCSSPGGFSWTNYVINGLTPESQAYAYHVDNAGATITASADTQ